LKKFAPYLLGGLALVVLLVLALNAPFAKPKNLDERISLRHRDKIPYGTYVAHQLLQASFSNAHITVDKNAPGYWNGIHPDSSNQAVFLVCKTFEPDNDELQKLARFVKAGNYVFIITKSLSYTASRFFNLNEESFYHDQAADSLQLSMNPSGAARQATFVYPGKQWDSYLPSFDTATVLPLGSTEAGNTNFIRLQSGSGRMFIHFAPLAFSNYFILHKSNVRYFQKAVSFVPQGVDRVVWNEYYVTHRGAKVKDPSVLRVLWQYPSFRWALVTAVATLLLYVLSAARRRQRVIPFYQKPVNDSLDFVRTMGRLYYDRKDHHNLSRKMAVFFIEHVRSRYKMVGNTPDEHFINELQAKSQYDGDELKRIAAFIQHIDTHPAVTEKQLAQFYRQLKIFYQKTGDGNIV
jgi:hypothetical protein